MEEVVEEEDLGPHGGLVQAMEYLVEEGREWLEDKLAEYCDDDYLVGINLQYLNHNTLTDIISFDYSVGNELHGDVFISIQRVRENAIEFDVAFEEELKRVMVHGVLHYCGYKDKSAKDKKEMRLKEDEKIKLFHVEQKNKTNPNSKP